MTYTVVILPRAEHDFQTLHDYIKERSPQGAASWANAFYKALKRLEQSPLTCGLAPESATSGRDVYQLIFRTRKGNPYRALFTIQDERVFIRHIRGYGQDIVDDLDLDDIELP